jgi:aryl-alcohol dehydrogenase-like predicted oxidoreductase
MHYRTLGNTGLRISEIGFGAWGIGGSMWLGGNDADSLRALHAAAELGVNFVDTALAYGDGHSESLVGRFVKERKEQIVIATKIPPKNGRWPARPGSLLKDVFPYDYIVRCTDRSLKHLGTARIDLTQFHVWLDDWADADEWKRAIEDLKRAGKIRFAGISINDHQPWNALRAAATGSIDSFQVIYNIFDQSPEDQLLPVAQEHGIGIIARVPFDEGALTGAIGPDSTFPRGDWRHDYFRGERKAEVAKRVEPLRALLGPEASTLPELALKFCLHHPAVSTVIPGMRTEKNVRMNCTASDGRKLSDTLVGELRKHRWEKNFY